MSQITVIVPIYNVETYLYRCINSIISQSYVDFDLILINDGSPDNCGSICDMYALKDPRIHVIHQKNGGLSAARNAGIDWAFTNSDSQWLTFIDSDDWIHPEYLSALYNAVVHTNVPVSTCHLIRTRGDTPIIEDILLSPYTVPSEELFTKYGMINTVACGKLYRKELFASIRYPLGRIHEDEYVTHRLLFSTDKIAVIDAPLYFYYYNEKSIMGAGWNPKHLSLLEARKLQLDFFSQHSYLVAYEFIYQFYLRDLVEANENVKHCSVPNKKKHLKSIQRDAHVALSQYALTSTPTIKTHPQIFEVAYPKKTWVYWQIKGLLHKFH